MESIYYQPKISLLYANYWMLYKWNHRQVRTPYWRLYWFEKRGAEIDVDGELCVMPEESFVLIAPNTLLNSYYTGEMWHFHAHFLMNEPYRSVAPGMYDTGPSSELEKHLALFLREKEAGRLKKAKAATIVCSMVFNVLSKLSSDLITENVERDPKIEKAREILETSDEVVTNQALAEKIGMSTNGFIRAFKKATGESPQHFGRRERVENACLRLQYTRDSIERIAEETGFYDRYHFTRVFNQYMNISPAEYRKRQKQSS